MRILLDLGAPLGRVVDIMKGFSGQFIVEFNRTICSV